MQAAERGRQGYSQGQGQWGSRKRCRGRWQGADGAGLPRPLPSTFTSRRHRHRRCALPQARDLHGAGMALVQRLPPPSSLVVLPLTRLPHPLPTPSPPMQAPTPALRTFSGPGPSRCWRDLHGAGVALMQRPPPVVLPLTRLPPPLLTPYLPMQAPTPALRTFSSPGPSRCWHGYGTATATAFRSPPRACKNTRAAAARSPRRITATSGAGLGFRASPSWTQMSRLQRACSRGAALSRRPP